MASWSPDDLPPAPRRAAAPGRSSGAAGRQRLAEVLAQLKHLAKLWADGYLTNEEFETAKALLLARPVDPDSRRG
jgi:hypothetical protein